MKCTQRSVLVYYLAIVIILLSNFGIHQSM